MATPDLVTTAEAARMLGRGIRTIHRLVEDGVLIPARRLGIGPNGAFVFSKADVEQLVKTRSLAKPKTDVPLVGLNVGDGDRRSGPPDRRAQSTATHPPTGSHQDRRKADGDRRKTA